MLEKIFKKKSGTGKKNFSFFLFWEKNSHWFFLLVLLLAVGAGIYLWYFRIYNYKWSEKRKLDYIQENINKSDLKEQLFDKISNEFKKRKSNLEKEYAPVRDIFQ